MPLISRLSPLGAAVATLTLLACSSGTPTSITQVGTNTGGSSGTTTGIKSNPCSATGTLQLSVATVAKVDCSNGGSTVTLAGGGASYLVMTQFANNVGPFSFVSYHARAATPAAAAAAVMADAARLMSARRFAREAPVGGGNSGLPVLKPRVMQNVADRFFRQRARQVMRSGTLAHPALRTRSLLGNAAVPAPPALGSIRSFQVANNISTISYGTSVAKLGYAGTNVLIYVDTLASNGFSTAQLTAYGNLVDQTLYPIDTTAFGAPADVDGNGRVIMLMTPVVNALVSSATCNSQGYVAGFFDANDFSSTDANSNKGEIFYSIAPDSTGKYSCAHTVADVNFAVPSTFLHELQHLINYSQHAVVRSSTPLDSWLDEGMSIVAEELGSLYYEKKCPPPSCRTNASQLFPDSSQGFVSSFLYDSYQYALLPDTASITLSDDASGGEAWRGGAWLLTRYLADQYGDRVLKSLETGPGDGLAAIAAATGQSFTSTYADFGLALYTDSLPGLARTTAPAVNRFSTRNLHQLWARLYATSAGSDVPTATPLTLAPLGTDTTTYIMYPGTMSYWRLDTPASSAAMTVQFSTPAYTGLSASLKPQIIIFRLPAGQ